MTNGALMLSGGIHDNYYTDITKYLTNKTSFKSRSAHNVYCLLEKQYKVSDYVPNIDELFMIVKHATDNLNIVGCWTLNVWKITFF